MGGYCRYSNLGLTKKMLKTNMEERLLYRQVFRYPDKGISVDLASMSHAGHVPYGSRPEMVRKKCVWY